jgi:hypothetical protein
MDEGFWDAVLAGAFGAFQPAINEPFGIWPHGSMEGDRAFCPLPAALPIIIRS